MSSQTLPVFLFIEPNLRSSRSRPCPVDKGPVRPFLERDLPKAWPSPSSVLPVGSLFWLGQGAKQEGLKAWVEKTEPGGLLLAPPLAGHANLDTFPSLAMPACIVGGWEARDTHIQGLPSLFV